VSEPADFPVNSNIKGAQRTLVVGGRIILYKHSIAVLIVRTMQQTSILQIYAPRKQLDVIFEIKLSATLLTHFSVPSE